MDVKISKLSKLVNVIMKKFFITLLVLLFLGSCAFTKNTEIVYGKSAQNEDSKLNIFIPNNSNGKSLPLLIYVYEPCQG